MHNAALRKMGRAYRDWAYLKFDVPARELGRALRLLHEKGFLGVNLTIPHKVDAVDMVAKTHGDAALMGAVNTLKWTGHGYEGYNTDGYGMARAIGEELGTGLAGAKVILLGAGGAARAAAVQCLREGVRELWIGNRNQERLGGLLALLQPHVREATLLKGFDLAHLPEELPKTALIINATSLGLKSGDKSPLNLAAEHFTRYCKVFDMIYNPATTPLIATARAREMDAANGLGMLVWQGARALEIWTGSDVPAKAMMLEAKKRLS